MYTTSGVSRLTKEGELCPEVDHAEEWEVQRDSIDERAYDARRANVLRSWIVSSFAAGPDHIMVVRAVWLISRMSGDPIAERLWSKGGVLWGDHGSRGIIDRKDNERQQHGTNEHGLW